MNYFDIQTNLINKYKIVIVEASTCRSRTHAHTDGTRRVCKWKKANSLASTFTLAHEIGHIMTFKSQMRRCESEYLATIWAIEELKKYNILVDEKIIKKYQYYIDMEKARGVRRGGSDYKDYNISNYDPREIEVLPIKEPKQPKPRKIRIL